MVAAFAVMPSSAGAVVPTPSAVKITSGRSGACASVQFSTAAVTASNASAPRCARFVSGLSHGAIVRQRKGQAGPLCCAASSEGPRAVEGLGPERNAVEHCLHLKYGALSSPSTSYNKDAPLPECDVIGLGQAMVSLAC